jgi:hypothetical protein
MSDVLAGFLIDPKALREALCVAQGAMLREPHTSLTEGQSKRISDLIRQIDMHRPIGSDGKHGNRHTPTCGCEDK